MKIYIIIGSLFLLSACFEKTDRNSILSQETYDGPAIELENVDILFSDSSVVKVKLTAAKQHILENDDMEFPDGIFLQFYDKHGKIISTLKGNSGFYFNKENYYKAEGNVHMINLYTQDELSSEELIWEPNDEKIRTEKFVTIKTEDEIHTGEGLISDQDFVKYKIIKPTGTISIEDENTSKTNNQNFK